MEYGGQAAVWRSQEEKGNPGITSIESWYYCQGQTETTGSLETLFNISQYGQYAIAPLNK